MQTTCHPSPECNDVRSLGSLGIVSMCKQGIANVTEDWQTQSLSLKNKGMGIGIKRIQEITE